MKDYANRNRSRRKNITRKKTVFRSKKNNSPLVSKNIVFGIIILAITMGAISFLYFETDVTSIKTRENTNIVKIDFPTSLIEGSVLIETDSKENFLSCEYFVQIGAYGNKKYAYEAKDILSEIEFITINEIFSNASPGKILHSVITGPYENRSAANNIKEKITNRGFDPQLRTLCKKN
jgi:cell division protein FtsN